jgi:hypothetical protein
MTAIALRMEREPSAPRPAIAARGEPGLSSFRDELAGRTPIMRITIPPVITPQLTADPAIAIAVAAATIVPPATPIPTLPEPGAAPIATPAIAPALTPLEQAVQTFLAQLGPDVDPEPAGEDDEQPETAGLAEATTPIATATPSPARVAPEAHRPAAIAPAAPIELPRAPEPPANPSHVHLVMEDGAERVVITVAVRGDEVRVAMRANDEATVAALARNAGSLDHALRARGLDLTDFTAGDRERSPQRHEPPPERQDPRAPRFRLEETA